MGKCCFGPLEAGEQAGPGRLPRGPEQLSGGPRTEHLPLMRGSGPRTHPAATRLRTVKAPQVDPPHIMSV